jgi:hypothetical protein
MPYVERGSVVAVRVIIECSGILYHEKGWLIVRVGVQIGYVGGGGSSSSSA